MARTDSYTQNVQVESPHAGGIVLMNDIGKDLVLLIYTDTTLDSIRITLPKNPIDGQKASIVTLYDIPSIILDGGTINGSVESLPVNGYVTYIYSSIIGQWFIIG